MLVEDYGIRIGFGAETVDWIKRRSVALCSKEFLDDGRSVENFDAH